MTSRVGVLRHAAGLAEATAVLTDLGARTSATVDLAAWEATNLLTVSTALTRAATLREETRGSHWREDFPERDDARLGGHLDVTLHDGVLDVTFTEAPVAPALDGVTG